MSISGAVLKRELMVESRNAANYKLRFWLGLAATGCAWFALLEYSAQPNGREAFMFLHRTLMAVIFVTGPALVADALNKERREGTLGLLFLTSLTAEKIVWGKFFSGFLKLTTFWLLSIPLVVIPVQQGGVSPGDMAFAIICQFNLAVIVTAAGLNVSSWRMNWGKALGAAYLMSGLIVVCFFGALFAVLVVVITEMSPQNFGSIGLEELFEIVVEGTVLLTLGANHFWTQFFSVPGVPPAIPKLLLVGSPAGALAVAVLLLRRAARNISSFDQFSEESRSAAWFKRVFLVPRFCKEGFKRSLQNKLKTNPFVWLEYRNTWSRALPAILVAVLILAESLSVSMFNSMFESHYWEFQSRAILLLALLVGFTAAGSFRKERECGAFELILVTPLRIDEILEGRVKAVWQYYKPVFFGFCFFLMLPVFFPATNLYHQDPDRMYFQIMVGCCAIYSLPYLGFYLALRFKNYLAVLGPALLLPVAAPLVFWELLESPLVSLNPERLPLIPVLFLWTWFLVSEAKKRGRELLDQRSVA